MSNYYLYKDLNGNKYEFSRLLGVANEIYQKICIEHGNCTGQALHTLYSGEASVVNKDGSIVGQTLTVYGCMIITDEMLRYLPEVFVSKLKTLEEARADGWFNEMQEE